jgi:hypothetical protein
MKANMKFSAPSLALAIAALSVSASAAALDWNATVTETAASVADCRDCDENISLLVSCERGQKQREVHFFLLEQRDDKLADKTAVVTVTADRKTQTVTATYSQPGEAGPYPVAKIASNDPLFELLSRATAAKFAANSEVTPFKLKGTRKAFREMNAVCP